jgi:EAL domain-containing protein (putative c-di-GMP-specific phosphodiesterase class I)
VLPALEPEIVKLDMTLMRDVHWVRTRQKLIRSMTSLCKGDAAFNAGLLKRVQVAPVIGHL